MKLQGGCMCKQDRYSIETDVSEPDAGYCHCRTCQLVTSSPVAVMFTVPEVRCCAAIVNLLDLFASTLDLSLTTGRR